jgi:hypothetical protein
MSKITTEHLSRGAFVYIRQSTSDQLTHNHESRRRQYGLADRAKQLGWSTVEVIDDDLGRSGGGIVRPRFERPKPRAYAPATNISLAKGLGCSNLTPCNPMQAHNRFGNTKCLFRQDRHFPSRRAISATRTSRHPRLRCSCLGDHGYRDLHVRNAHRHLCALSGRWITRKPLRPFFIGPGEIFLVGDNQSRADRLFQAAASCLQNGGNVAKALCDLRLHRTLHDLPCRWVNWRCP